MNNIYIPYTYLIGWTTYGKWYYGTRFAKGCHPSDLWVTYFTSSKHVKAFREQCGEPDVIQVRRVFSDAESAKLWEDSLLRRIPRNDYNKWLNKKFGSYYDTGPRTPEHNQRISAALMGHTLSEETVAKLRLARSKAAPVYSDEYRDAARSRMLGKQLRLGIKQSDETKANSVSCLLV